MELLKERCYFAEVYRKEIDLELFNAANQFILGIVLDLVCY